MPRDRTVANAILEATSFSELIALLGQLSRVMGLGPIARCT